MSESITDSGHDTTSTFGTSQSGLFEGSDTIGRIANNKPTTYNNNLDALPKLPSHKFRYSVWHDLRQTCLTGDQLHAPRVRAGPELKEKQFHDVIEDGLPIHHDLGGKRRQNHMNQAENWEDAKVINLCYQELSHEYQWKNFYRILSRCQAAHTVNLSYNKIRYLHEIQFSSCEYINLNANYLTSIGHFPSLPRVKKLVATNNNIKTLYGLKKLQGSPLEELYLSGNDVAFQLNYRNRVFSILPNLRVLDGVARSPNEYTMYIPEENSFCTIL